MDRISCAVLDKICAVSTLGRYSILEEGELLDGLPEDSERSVAELKRAIKTLSGEGYIDLKYSDGTVYCVAPLKTFAPAEPTVPEEEKAEETVTEPPLKRTFTFWAAFAGGAVGSLIISLIFALI